MSASEVMSRVKKNPASMANGLPSTESVRHYDWCCGIHGAARHRKGVKRGTSAARRRDEKRIIRAAMEES